MRTFRISLVVFTLSLVMAIPAFAAGSSSSTSALIQAYWAAHGYKVGTTGSGSGTAAGGSTSGSGSSSGSGTSVSGSGQGSSGSGSGSGSSSSTSSLIARYWAARGYNVGGGTGTGSSSGGSSGSSGSGGSSSGTSGSSASSGSSGSSSGSGGTSSGSGGSNSGSGSGSSSGSGSASLTSTERQLVSLINQGRAAAGLAPLTVDPKVEQVAQIRNKALQAYFEQNKNLPPEHNLPGLGHSWDVANSLGIRYTTFGENEAANRNMVVANQRLFASPGHRANLLNPAFHHLGVSVLPLPGLNGVVVSEEFSS